MRVGTKPNSNITNEILGKYFNAEIASNIISQLLQRNRKRQMKRYRF